ncbi:hypothetical protein H8E77_14725 [bacterium]|nr:hypothetical protein [bacterium]
MTTGQLAELQREIFEVTQLLQNIQTPLRHPTDGTTIFIGDLRSDEYRLNTPIPVTIEYDEDTVIASFYDVEEYGVGEDLEGALSDLRAGLVKYYESLEENVHCLGPLPTRHWKYLKTLISCQENM